MKKASDIETSYFVRRQKLLDERKRTTQRSIVVDKARLTSPNKTVSTKESILGLKDYLSAGGFCMSVATDSIRSPGWDSCGQKL